MKMRKIISVVAAMSLAASVSIMPSIANAEDAFEIMANYDYENGTPLQWTSKYIVKEEDGNHFVRSTELTINGQLDGGDAMQEYSAIAAKSNNPAYGLRVSFKFRAEQLGENQISLFPFHAPKFGINLILTDNTIVYVGNENKKAVAGVTFEAGKWYNYTADINYVKKTITASISDGTNTYTSPVVNISDGGIYWLASDNNERGLRNFRLMPATAGKYLDIDDIKTYKLNMKSVTPKIEGPGTVSGGGVYIATDKTSRLTAVPDEIIATEFKGWYLGDELVSNELVYDAPASKGTEYTAKFERLYVTEFGGVDTFEVGHSNVPWKDQNNYEIISDPGDTNTFLRAKKDEQSQVTNQKNVGDVWKYSAKAISLGDNQVGLRVNFKFRVADLNKNVISLLAMHQKANALSVMTCDTSGNVWTGLNSNDKNTRIKGFRLEPNKWYDYSVDINYTNKTVTAKVFDGEKWYKSGLVSLKNDSINWTQRGYTDRGIGNMQLRTANTLDVDDWEFLKLNMVPVNVDAKGNGTVTGSGMYAYDRTATLTAVPAEGSKFTGWSDGNKEAVREVNVADTAQYTALFETAKLTISGDAQITAAGILSNSGNEPLNGKIIIAQYDKDGKLLKVSLDSVRVEANVFEDKTFTLNDSKEAEAKTVKAFLWNNNMQPLTEQAILQ